MSHKHQRSQMEEGGGEKGRENDRTCFSRKQIIASEQLAASPLFQLVLIGQSGPYSISSTIRFNSPVTKSFPQCMTAIGGLKIIHLLCKKSPLLFPRQLTPNSVSKTCINCLTDLQTRNATVLSSVA